MKTGILSVFFLGAALLIAAQERKIIAGQRRDSS